jgi:hypothetical protein
MDKVGGISSRISFWNSEVIVVCLARFDFSIDLFVFGYGFFLIFVVVNVCYL